MCWFCLYYAVARRNQYVAKSAGMLRGTPPMLHARAVWREPGFGDVKEFNIKMRNVFESRLVGSSRVGSSRVGSSRVGSSRVGSSRGDSSRGSKRVSPAEAYIMSETPADTAALAG